MEQNATAAELDAPAKAAANVDPQPGTEPRTDFVTLTAARAKRACIDLHAAAISRQPANA